MCVFSSRTSPPFLSLLFLVDSCVIGERCFVALLYPLLPLFVPLNLGFFSFFFLFLFSFFVRFPVFCVFVLCRLSSFFSKKKRRDKKFDRDDDLTIVRVSDEFFGDFKNLTDSIRFLFCVFFFLFFLFHFHQSSFFFSSFLSLFPFLFFLGSSLVVMPTKQLKTTCNFL